MVDLRWILETLPVGVWVGQVPHGEVTYANPEFRAIMGMDAVQEATITDAPATYSIFNRDGELYPVDKLPFSRVVSTGKPSTVDDLVIHRPDGMTAHVRAFAYPKFNANAEMTHVVIAFMDITSEVKAELEREQIGSRLALAVNHTPIAIWAVDSIGTITLSEGAALASLGLKSGELVGENIFERYGNHPSIPGYVRRGLAGESFWYTLEYGGVTFDTWLTPLRNPAGDIIGVSGVSRDVSEVRVLQAKAIQNDRISALGTLAASVAHEINNPLTYMLGQQAFLRETLQDIERESDLLSGPAREQCRRLVAQIHQVMEPLRAGTERIATITRELRSFTRPAAQQNGHIDVRSVVESVLKLVRKELEARATLELILEETRPVSGDSTRLVQVVMNLIVNAMQAVSGDRSEFDRIRVRTGNEGSSVVIEIADSGPGVPPEDRERIFDPFVTTKSVGEGTGLGLFVCRNIVRDLSGKISVGERPGGGALFRVELPVLVTQPVEMPSRVTHGATGDVHVLIIDDEFLVAKLLARQLSSVGYRTSIETDPESALDMLSSDGAGFDLIYCDLMMKPMHGMDLADALAVRNPSLLGRMVFMTGGAFTPRAQAFQEIHAERCVDKPFDVLVETARRLKKIGKAAV